jgi:uncharacterized protein YdcH (DUF465 family)
MGRKSTIARLPTEVRELIGSLRKQGRTLDEIMEKLQELDVQVSRAALGRHTKQIDAIADHMRKSRDMARALTERFGDEGIGDLARYNLQVAHGLLMRLMISEEGEPIQLDAKEAMFLTSAIKNVTAAAKADADRETKVRAQIAAQAAEVAEETVAELKKVGMSAEGAEAIRARILGVAGA